MVSWTPKVHSKVHAGDQVRIDIEATSKPGYDPSWLRNAVEEPLDEADIEPEAPGY